MTALTEHQQRALEVITGRTAAGPITGKEIAALIGLKPRATGKDGADMRSIIHALRVKGYPVCATGSGYWWPRDRVELQAYIDSFQARVDDQQAAVDGLRLGLGLLKGTTGQTGAVPGRVSGRGLVPFKLPTGVRLVPEDRVEEFRVQHPEAVAL